MLCLLQVHSKGTHTRTLTFLGVHRAVREAQRRQPGLWHHVQNRSHEPPGKGFSSHMQSSLHGQTDGNTGVNAILR